MPKQKNTVDKKISFPFLLVREKVISKICEAYENFIKSGKKAILEANGEYRIEEFIGEGVKIRIHITPKGLITSAYPILERGIYK